VDIRCPICGEPWDMDCIHDAVQAKYGRVGYVDGRYVQSEYDPYYSRVRDDFRRRGCVAIGGDPCERSERGTTAAVILDFMGDDIDGAAAMLEDAEALGLF